MAVRSGNSHVTSAKRSGLVSVMGNGINTATEANHYWATYSGGEKSAPVKKVYNGGSIPPDIIKGRSDISNIVVSRPYLPYRDQPLVRLFNEAIDKGTTYTVSIADLDPDGITLGLARNYTSCLVVRVRGRDYDASSSDEATIEVEFAPQNLTNGT